MFRKLKACLLYVEGVRGALIIVDLQHFNLLFYNLQLMNFTQSIKFFGKIYNNTLNLAKSKYSATFLSTKKQYCSFKLAIDLFLYSRKILNGDVKVCPSKNKSNRAHQQ